MNYSPVSGTLTFADGQTMATILVPVIDDYYNNHDNYVPLMLTSPTGGAVLGTTTTTLLTIHDPNPDFTPPQVTGLNWYGTATRSLRVVLTFSEPLQSGVADNPASYQLSNLGSSGLANPAASLPVGFAAPSTTLGNGLRNALPDSVSACRKLLSNSGRWNRGPAVGRPGGQCSRRSWSGFDRHELYGPVRTGNDPQVL